MELPPWTEPPREIRNERAAQALEVDARVLEEAAVFQAHRGADDPGGHLFQRHEGAITAEGPWVEAFVQEMIAGAVVDAHRFKLFLFGFDRAGVGQALCEIGVDAGHRAYG